MDNLTNGFREQVLSFLKRHEMSDGKFGELSGLGWNYVHRLRQGVASRSTTIDKARDFMSMYDKSIKQPDK